MTAPREHPMLFSAPMVRALLRESAPKTVTRRLINSRSAYFGSANNAFWNHCAMDRAWVDGKGSTEEYLHVPCHRGDEAALLRLDTMWGDRGQPNGYRDQYPDCGPCETCDAQGWRMTCHRLWARIRPGHRIWVKETFQENEPPSGWIYRADDVAGHIESGWRPPIFMPRHASRLTLEVLSVKAQRLQDITEEDAIREGVEPWLPGHGPVTAAEIAAEPCLSSSVAYRDGFEILWDEINGKRAPWESNPLVWRYEVRREQ